MEENPHIRIFGLDLVKTGQMLMCLPAADLKLVRYDAHLIQCFPLAYQKSSENKLIIDSYLNNLHKLHNVYEF